MKRACLDYVDLNPIRAKMAEIPETSEYTSVAERLTSLGHDHEETTSNPEAKQPGHLLPFVGNPRKDTQGTPLQAYLTVRGQSEFTLPHRFGYAITYSQKQ